MRKLAADAIAAVHAGFVLSAMLAAVLAPPWVILLMAGAEWFLHWWTGDCPLSVWENILRYGDLRKRHSFVHRLLVWLNVGDFTEPQIARLTLFWFSALCLQAMARWLWGWL